MGSRAQVDYSIIERRLRPIYDLLDSGNNKKAMQEADKVLRKQPNLQCAKVLKGLAALRLGRQEDCSSLINSVANETPTDETTLQALTICYREMHKPQEICKLYECAVKSFPTNEDLLTHLFMSYVRISNYKKQQQVAMQLYKIKPKNPYYFWAIMSIVMQAKTNSDPAARTVSLMLAERMLTNFINDDKINAEAEVLTYLYILEIQNKYPEALAVLQGSLAKKITQQPQNFIQLRKANYLMELKQWEEANIIYKDLIQKEPDSWQYYVNYVKTLDELCIESEQPLKEGLVFLKEIWDKACSDKCKFRAPYLGILQLALCVRQRGTFHEYESFQDKIIEVIYHYISSFGDKMCCYGDIENFLPLIPKDCITNFLNRVFKLITFNEDGVPKDVYGIYRHQIWLQLRKSLGQMDSFSTSEHLEFAEGLVTCYHKTAHLSADMASTDIRPNDAYLIIAMHSYLAVLPSLNSTSVNNYNINEVLVQMLAILGHGIDVSKANFQLQLLLVKIYNLIGATYAGFEIYEKMDLKHIQLDTLGHVILFQLLDAGIFSFFNSTVSNTLKFFLSNFKDTSDPMILSYKFGSLTKVPEFVEFRERLNNSSHFAMVKVENMALELTNNVTSQESLNEVIKSLDVNLLKEKCDISKLCDNRDLKVMNCWDPNSRCQIEEAKCQSFKDDCQLLHIKEVILEILMGINEMTTTTNNKSSDKENKENGYINSNDINNYSTENLNDHISELEEASTHLSKCTTNTLSQLTIRGPDMNRLSIYSSSGCLPYFIVNSRIFLEVHRCTADKDGLEKWNNEYIKLANSISENLLSHHMQVLTKLRLSCQTMSIEENSKGFASIFIYLQTIGFVAILLSYCQVLLKPIKVAISKRNKKKKEAQQMPVAIIEYNNYVGSVIHTIEKFETALSELQVATKKVHKENLSNNTQWISDKKNVLLPNLDYLENACSNIDESYSNSINNLVQFTNSKLKFVTSLRL